MDAHLGVTATADELGRTNFTLLEGVQLSSLATEQAQAASAAVRPYC